MMVPAMTSLQQSVLGAIGDTPLVRLDRLVAHHGCEGTILAKLDHLNPGFSKKDRAALGMPSFGDTLSVQGSDAIHAYVLSLQHALHAAGSD